MTHCIIYESNSHALIVINKSVIYLICTDSKIIWLSSSIQLSSQSCQVVFKVVFDSCQQKKQPDIDVQ